MIDGQTIGLVAAGCVGACGIAITVVAMPFVTPGFRRLCLPFIPATPVQMNNVLAVLKHFNPSNKPLSLIDIGSGDGRIFAQHLQTHLTPEWRVKYIDYDMLKDSLYAYVAQVPPAHEPEARKTYWALKDREFFRLCNRELDKINKFYDAKLTEASSRWSTLKNELEATLIHMGLSPESKEIEIDIPSRRQQVPHPFTKTGRARLARDSEVVHADKSIKTLRTLKQAFPEFYLSLVLIQNFKVLNREGFRKILKKHDKLFDKTETGTQFRARRVEVSRFVCDKLIDDLIGETEEVFIEKLEKGDRSHAMARLRVLPLSEKQSPWTTFRLGMFSGIFAVILAVLILSMATRLNDHNEAPLSLGVRLFRPFLIVFVHVLLMGINVYSWQSAGVNHVLIFEIDPRNHLTYQSLMEIAAAFLCLWGLCALGYVFHNELHAPALAFPLVLFLITVCCMLFPLDVFARSSRFWIMKYVLRCFTPVCRVVNFPDFWLADQMNSLVTVFLDVQYFICFYACKVDWTDNLSIIRGHLNINNSTINSSMANVTHVTDDVCQSNIYTIRMLVAMVPAGIRFCQCLRRYYDSKHKHPHITNAIKYSTTFFVVGFKFLSKAFEGYEVLFAMWILAYIVSTLYTYTWDVVMDWGLLSITFADEKKDEEEARSEGGSDLKLSIRSEKSLNGKVSWDKTEPRDMLTQNSILSVRNSNVGNNPGLKIECCNKFGIRILRDELICSKIWLYYTAIVADFVLRLVWTLNISLATQLKGAENATTYEILVCVTAGLECFRRFMWNYFRLENEHLNNCGDFRAVRDISIRPLPPKKESAIDLVAANSKVRGTASSMTAPIVGGMGTMSPFPEPVMKMNKVGSGVYHMWDMFAAAATPFNSNRLKRRRSSVPAKMSEGTGLGQSGRDLPIVREPVEDLAITPVHEPKIETGSLPETANVDTHEKEALLPSSPRVKFSVVPEMDNSSDEDSFMPTNRRKHV